MFDLRARAMIRREDSPTVNSGIIPEFYVYLGFQSLYMCEIIAHHYNTCGTLVQNQLSGFYLFFVPWHLGVSDKRQAPK